MKEPATTEKIKIGIDSSKSPINEIKKKKHITLSEQFQDSMGKMVDFKTFKRKIKETVSSVSTKNQKKNKIVNNQVLLGNNISNGSFHPVTTN